MEKVKATWRKLFNAGLHNACLQLSLCYSENVFLGTG